MDIENLSVELMCMGLLTYLSILKGHKALMCLLILLFAAAIVSGDVSIQNQYFTTGSESFEDIYLKGMDYSNSVTITQASYSADSSAIVSNQSHESIFDDDVVMHHMGGVQGASLQLNSMDTNATRSIYGGESGSVSYSYLINSGIAQIDYLTPFSLYSEDITLVNNEYSGRFGVFDNDAYSSGEGVGTSKDDSPGSLKHVISMVYLDKYCNINSYLNTGAAKSGNAPVRYTWSGYSSQRDYAIAGIRMNVTPGNSLTEFGIHGNSSILDDKYSPDRINDTYPAVFDDGSTSSPMTLIMQYRLNKTGPVGVDNEV